MPSHATGLLDSPTPSSDSALFEKIVQPAPKISRSEHALIDAFTLKIPQVDTLVVKYNPLHSEASKERDDMVLSLKNYLTNHPEIKNLIFDVSHGIYDLEDTRSALYCLRHALGRRDVLTVVSSDPELIEALKPLSDDGAVRVEHSLSTLDFKLNVDDIKSALISEYERRQEKRISENRLSSPNDTISEHNTLTVETKSNGGVLFIVVKPKDTKNRTVDSTSDEFKNKIAYAIDYARATLGDEFSQATLDLRLVTTQNGSTVKNLWTISVNKDIKFSVVASDSQKALVECFKTLKMDKKLGLMVA